MPSQPDAGAGEVFPPLRPATSEALAAIWRLESARTVGALVRYARDFSLGEDAAQHAWESAVRQWPAEGIPTRPGAWLITVGKRWLVDTWRRDASFARRMPHVMGDQTIPGVDAEAVALASGAVKDDVLRLMFLLAHPSLPRKARVALTLRYVGGFTTAEIARALLVPETTMAQRLVRARGAVVEHGLDIEAAAALNDSVAIAGVLDVIYLIFNEGYAASGGPDAVRVDLAFEGLRLARSLAALLPYEPDAWALAALLEFQSSRFDSRSDPDGVPIPLLSQDRSRWDRLRIRRGREALQRAVALGGGSRPYALQAGIAAVHAGTARGEDTDWAAIFALYGHLETVAPSPVVRLNRAVAQAFAGHVPEALAAIEELRHDPSLRDYAPLAASQAEVLEMAGRPVDAGACWEEAARATSVPGERRLYQRRAALLAGGAMPGHGVADSCATSGPMTRP